jgi:dTMP kinase
MPTHGKLIAIEGIDGSGKRTQLDLLVQELKSRRVPLFRISFPCYESAFGRLVARYLNGDFGPLEAVDPHLSAVLYAGDRFEAKSRLESELAAGRNVLADRYVPSNLAHQTARLPAKLREPFLRWLRHLEYEIYGLPPEDLVLYLRLPAAQAHDLIMRKPARGYTGLRRDLQEADIRHLERAATLYDQLSKGPRWRVIECLDPVTKTLRPTEDISSEVFTTVARVLGLESRPRASAP